MNLIKPRAQMIFDGYKFTMPDDCPVPRHDQMVGSDADKLVEYAGRCCYDSLNSPRSRGSDEYHQHIRDVNHSSVLAHASWVFRLSMASGPVYLRDHTKLAIAASLTNRPGVEIYPCPKDHDCLRLRANLRSIRQWSRWPAHFQPEIAKAIGLALQQEGRWLAPLAGKNMAGTDDQLTKFSIKLDMAEPIEDWEIWASFDCIGSRGMSHELVRHTKNVGISQRSTRFCDETDTAWVPHPLIWQAGCAEQTDLFRDRASVEYETLMGRIQDHLKEQGVEDPLARRKQARGAARAVLGTALMTRLVFSADLSMWKWMLHERMSEAADAEIRHLFNDIFASLVMRWPDRFAGWATAPARVGGGLILTAFGEDEKCYGWKVC